MAEFHREYNGRGQNDELPSPSNIASNEDFTNVETHISNDGTRTTTTTTTRQYYVEEVGNSQQQQQRVDSPASIDYEGAPNGSSNTPPKNGVPQSSSRSSATTPRPISKSPSEYLTRTTAARRHDGEALEQRRNSLIQPEPRPAPASSSKQKGSPNGGAGGPGAAGGASAGPSDRLMRTTQARLSDVREWQMQKGVIKHADDIWWEQRKPTETARKDVVPVESRLYEPTTSHIYSQRKKVPPRATPDRPTSTPGAGEGGTPDKTPRGSGIPGSGRKTATPKKISNDSPLLRSTFNSVVKNVKTTPVAPRAPTLALESQSTGPQNVPSRLHDVTTSVASAHWKSKEEQQREEEEFALMQARANKKVKAPSSHLLNYNTAMKHGSRDKARPKDQDQREAGWNNKFKKDVIPSVDEVRPLPLQTGGPGMGSNIQRSPSRGSPAAASRFGRGGGEGSPGEGGGDGTYYYDDGHGGVYASSSNQQQQQYGEYYDGEDQNGSYQGAGAEGGEDYEEEDGIYQEGGAGAAEAIDAAADAIEQVDLSEGGTGN
eukprot:CAMPEP_0174985308 /NCGR_PEP_ID=MMETSP0004_2-20121128/18266_1 /TAXON_ID=420556 /ORGANISM="Ochromonas sp., Strain CCMP1393" /LENGTH=544 /DNA_ID=CAMNT_0016237935 /DNA_START=76 /DNA_END=1710 /DNA_ORIENTATION=+